MNDPMKMKSESFKKTVERYREDMMKLAKQNERFSRPQSQKPNPEPQPVEPPRVSENDDRLLREEQELQKLFERIREAREEIERLEERKRTLERTFEQPQIDVDYWSVENMRRLPNSIPVPERELPFTNSSVVLPPPNEGPGENDNDIIDFNREPAEWETEMTVEDEFNEPAVFAQTTENNTEIDITENNFSPFAPNGDRILRPDYRMAHVTEPVERLEKTPTEMKPPQENAELTGRADLIVQVFTARQALPISGARVTVSRMSGAQGMEGIATHITDENGKTPAISLPTPPKYLSEAPSNIRPYSEYVVGVKKEGYYDNIVRGIQMFDSITTIEPVNMIPLPMGQSGGEEEFDISDYEL